MSKFNQGEAIEESVQANLINEVNNQLPELLPKAVSDYVEPRLEITVRDVLQKNPINLFKSSSTSTSPDLFTEYDLDKAIAKGKIDSAKVLKKRCHDDRDEDPPVKYERKRRGENERIVSHQKTIKMVHLRKTNPEGDRCSFDKSKPIPLQGPPSHLTILVDFFFNNDLEYLKTRNKERKYIASLTKTKAI
nr:hypothetical protein [Tanacetum cinerariifolium]